MNSISDREQTAPHIGIDTAGNFIIAWQSRDLDYPDDRFGIYEQSFAANGTRLGGGQFLVNSNTPRDQIAPSITVAADGSYVIAWADKRQDNADGSFGVFGQRYNSDGTRRGDEFQINGWTAKDQSAPALASGDQGQFVAVWQSRDQDTGDSWGIYGQRYKETAGVSAAAGA